MGAPVVLIGVEWTLVHLRRDGALSSRPTGQARVVLRVQRRRPDVRYRRLAISSSARPVVISGARLAVGRIGTTLVGCPGIVDFTTAVGAVLGWRGGLDRARRRPDPSAPRTVDALWYERRRFDLPVRPSGTARAACASPKGRTEPATTGWSTRPSMIECRWRWSIAMRRRRVGPLGHHDGTGLVRAGAVSDVDSAMSGRR